MKIGLNTIYDFGLTGYQIIFVLCIAISILPLMKFRQVAMIAQFLDLIIFSQKQFRYPQVSLAKVNSNSSDILKYPW